MVRHKTIGPAQTILGPVKGQGIKRPLFNIYLVLFNFSERIFLEIYELRPKFRRNSRRLQHCVILNPSPIVKKPLNIADNEIISRMIERMKKLVNSHSVQRAFCSNFNDVNEVMNLVELRVVREFNLPDTYASVLQVIHFISLSFRYISR